MFSFINRQYPAKEILSWQNHSVQIIRSKRRKRSISCRVDYQDRKQVVIVRAPKTLSAREIRVFLQKNRKSIEKLVIQATKSKKKNSILQNGSKLPFMGKEYPLLITENTTNNIKKPYAQYIPNTMVMVETPTSISQTKLRQIIQTMYHQEALTLLTKKSQFWADKMNLQFKKVRIKDMTSRWGSCSSLQNLNYRWQIILAPEHIIDYLVIHEVSHLKYPNHSQDYWQWVARYDPNYKQNRRWLKKQGRQLAF